MASSVPAPPVQVNGDGLCDPNTRRYAEFYAQLLRIRDDVYAGKHPRLKVPDGVPEKVAAQFVQSRPSPTSRPATNGTSSSTVPPAHPSYTSQGSSPYISTPIHSYPRPSSSQRPPSLKPSSSGIDPVLLTKSDDLVRAEIQLKRQRIERVLKDQVDQKRNQSRDGDFGGHTDARLDVSDIFAKALALVPPVSGLRPEANRNSPASDSFDENSYYSSQANSWTSDEREGSTNGAMASAAETAQGKLGDDARTGNAGGVNGASPAGAQERAMSQTDNVNDDTDMLEDGEESDYEPPAADAFTIVPPTNNNTPHNDTVSGPGGLSRSFNSSNGSLPSPTVPIIMNHIRTPVAPQPARVSPLTFAKVSGLDTSHGPGGQDVAASAPSSPRNGRGRGSGRQSPVGSARQQINSRKRRREVKEVERAEKQRRVSNREKHRAAESPEPQIKEEPVSPPPLAGFTETPQSRRRARPLPDDVEIISPREARPRPVYYMEYEQPPAPRYEYEEPTIIRVPSRASYRRVERDDHDLRRVASLQYARRPYSPQPVPYEPGRAASHYIEGPAPIYREGSVRPGATRYIRSERSISPTYATDPYQRTRSPAIMAPPPAPRRIVVDQHGNRFYAEPAPMSMRTSVAPSTRRRVEDPMYERAPTREPTMRPVARAMEPYEDEGMAPPPRRYIEQPEVEVVDPRVYRQREYSMRPVEREEIVPAQEPIERRPVARYEDMPPPPRDYITRSYSVRPEAVRREIPAEYVSRHGSVAPGREYVRREALPEGYRAVSVVHGEPVPYEERRYASYVPQQSARRYVDEQDMMEPAQEQYGEPRNVTYRY
ncbi:uncharacterized protein K452DRAFT_292112 [Aplosporella prunicola CBS 121167]|uniref:Uncharacterized protein n=1 Tax=Aplosporella prunicola CBS 121167 TaxID=1176127 RepID=A0A6A6AXV5_9PEZI|nr:uncharacterized protein K452DRAFT_292112 [Aplosporella prunicola CBS 121167]KAF2136782.1 hypothetical protein K452DRAFT_292112 [Aplosporella prunicola CBS 121167]